MSDVTVGFEQDNPPERVEDLQPGEVFTWSLTGAVCLVLGNKKSSDWRDSRVLFLMNTHNNYVFTEEVCGNQKIYDYHGRLKFTVPL